MICKITFPDQRIHFIGSILHFNISTDKPVLFIHETLMSHLEVNLFPSIALQRPIIDKITVRILEIPAAPVEDDIPKRCGSSFIQPF